MVRDLIGGGFGFSVGSSVISKLPASAAQANVQAGISSASGFFPLLGTLKGSEITFRQLKKLRKK